MIIQQTKRRVPSKPEFNGGKRITLPGLYVKPYESIQQYSDKSAEEKAAGYFADEGMPIPDFEKMDKIERLEALSQWKAKAIETRSMLDERNSEAAKAAIQADIDNKIQQKVNEFKQQHSATAGGNTGKA